MNHIVKYLGCNEKDEFEYYFEIKGQRIIVFNMFGEPTMLALGSYCSIEVNLFWANECHIELIKEKKYSIEKTDNSYYAYYLYGKLEGNTIDLNDFVLDDEMFANYKKFQGKFVKVKVDRIDIRVLEKV
jgi:hypothetical protein